MTTLEHTYMMHDARGKIKELQKLIDSPNVSEKRRFKARILIWVYIGIVEHQINLSKLYRVSKTYKRIGIVPEGYM